MAKKINVIIPAYNEEPRISKTLKTYHSYFYGPSTQSNVGKNCDLRLYVINDGSTDKTAKITEKILKELDMPSEMIDSHPNKGKGYAVKYGMLNSRPADLYYLADADLSSEWNVLDQLLEVLTSKDYDCVIGSRAIVNSETKTSAHRLISGRASNFLINIFLNLGFQDTQCGYKLFTKKSLKAFEAQRINRWGFDFEILYLLKKLKYKVTEIGIKWENREGSHVKFKDYFATLKQLIKVRTTKYNL
jgi:dolichyl-phosphate beta-glucosyltransferase